MSPRNGHPGADDARAEELRASESRFRSAFDDAPIGMVMVSLEQEAHGRYLRVNRAFCQMVGFPAEQLLQRGLSDITHPDDRLGDAGMLAELADSGHVSREKRYVHRDGGVVWAALRGTALTDAAGRRYALEHVVDITADKRAAAEQRSSAQRSKQLAAFLSEINAAGTDLDKVVAAATLHVTEEFADLCHIMVARDDDPDCFESLALAHRDPQAAQYVADALTKAPYRRGEGLVADVLRTGAPVVAGLDDPSVRARLRPDFDAFQERWPLTSVAIVPLAVPGQVGGVLLLGRGEAQPSFGEADVAVMTDMCASLAVALDRARNHRRRAQAEAAVRTALADLAQTNEELNALLEHIPNMVFVKDARDLRFVRFNRAGEQLLGRSRDELLGRNDHDFFPRDQANFFTANDRAVLASGEVLDIAEEPIETTSGRRWLHTRKVPLYDPDGRPRYLLGIAEDITESRQAAAALHRSERHFRQLFEDAPIGMAILGAEGSYDRVNRAFANFLGYAPEEMSQHGVRAVTHPDDLESDLASIAALLEGRTETCQIEKRYLHRDGTTVWGLVTSFALRDADGQPKQLIRHVQDITARKRSHELLTVLFDELPDNLSIAGADGRFKRLNPAWERTLGWSLAELQAVPFEEFVHPDDRERTREVFRELRGGKRIVAFENRYRCRDGSYRWLAWNSVPVPEEGYVVANARDATEQKMQAAELERHRQELQRSNAELTQFAYVASHDLQAPLRSIRTFLEMVSHELAPQLADNEEAAEHFGRVLSAAERMQAMIRDLLSYSRVGRQAPHAVPTDVGEVVAGITADLAAEIRRTGADIRCDEPLPTVAVDASQFKQLLQNLVENALKYAGDEPPCVRIGAQNTSRDEWLFEVQDNGIGLDPAHADRIFQVFQRLHTRDRYPGTGIGLAICEKIVRAHGGRIWVDSEPGHGATFRFTVPQPRSTS